MGIPTDDEQLLCIVCQTANEIGAGECVSCGVDLADSADTPSDEAAAGDPDAAEEVADDDAARSQAPRDNLIRARMGSGVELRDVAGLEGSGTGTLMFGHFSEFNSWYEIDSYWEGQFLERIAPGAFAQTMVEDRSGMKVLFDHGFDPELGNKPLGPITELREDDIGAYYEVPLLDTGYNRDFVLPALQGRLMSGQQVGSLLGASFRFMVLEESWDRSGAITADNPAGLPLRTITRAQVMEFGPVTFPANQGATSGVRSMTDDFMDRMHTDPTFVARFTERAGLKVVEKILSARAAGGPRTGGTATPTAEPADGRSARVNHLRRKARVLLAEI
jgi:HK97 family phage prohead protease